MNEFHQVRHSSSTCLAYTISLLSGCQLSWNTPADVMDVNVNRWRNRALIFMFGGFFVMYFGVFSRSLLPYLTVIGGIGVATGILLYFRFGPVNQSIATIQCPRCGELTRPTGEYDACSHCQQPLKRTEDGTYEPYVKPQ